MVWVSSLDNQVEWDPFLVLIKYLVVYSLVTIILDICDFVNNHICFNITYTEAPIHKFELLPCAKLIKLLYCHVLRCPMNSVVACVGITINLINIVLIFENCRESFV